MNEQESVMNDKERLAIWYDRAKRNAKEEILEAFIKAIGLDKYIEQEIEKHERAYHDQGD